MDFNSCTGHPYTAKLFIDMEKSSGGKSEHFLNKQALVTRSTPI